MRPSLFTLLGMMLACSPVAAQQLGGDLGVLSESDGKHLIDLIKDTDKALGEEDIRFAHFQSLVGPVVKHRMIAQAPGIVQGVEFLEVNFGTGADSVFNLYFASRATAQKFRDQVSAAFGAPDPACTNVEEAHWSPRPGLSLHMKVIDFNDAASASFALRGSDPVDANCARSSSGKDRQLDAEKTTAFLRRIVVEPPPFTDAAGMSDWLRPYGTGDATMMECSGDIFTKQPAQFPGVDFMGATIWTCSTGPNARPSSISILTGVTDMFALDRLRQALTAAYGDKDSACSYDTREVWKVSDRLTAILVPQFPSSGLTVSTTPISSIEDCGPR